MSTITSLLEINQYKIQLHLGFGEQERSKKQEVEISIKIFFNILPDACTSDNLGETICYDNLCKRIKDFCGKREFKLIEYLCGELYRLIKKETKFPISINVKKNNPPIKDLIGGTSFTISDFEICKI